MLKFCFTIFITLSLFSPFSKADGITERPLNCLAQVRCTNIENTTWATDGRRCYVVRNPCLLRNANCARLRRNEPLLRTIPKVKCQKLCPVACTMQYDPVCAEYRGQHRQFGNNCQLGVHICQTGETYQFLFKGECKQNEPVQVREE